MRFLFLLKILGLNIKIVVQGIVIFTEIIFVAIAEIIFEIIFAFIDIFQFVQFRFILILEIVFMLLATFVAAKHMTPEMNSFFFDL